MQTSLLKHLSILLLLMLVYTVQSQTVVTGKVVEDVSSVPIIGAAVIISGTTIGTVTDIDGNFSLRVNELPVTLDISYTGFSSISMDVNSADIGTIEMSEGLAIDEIVVVGTRGRARSVLSSPVPIDNINASELKRSGQETIEQMINYRVPSYNSTNQTISDATAHFDPSELRNLGPSRTLVLVNGKRKNQSALVYVNDTPGKGEVGTDMKSIPASAIKRIEVLRDGASAQYGSDAIAGVVNIVLKDSPSDGELSVGGGFTTEGDGVQYNADINKGFELGSSGYLNLTAGYYHQDETNRAGEPGKDDLFGVDGTNPWIQANPDLGMTIGQPEYDKISLAANMGTSYSDNKGKFYVFGNYTYRDGTSFALYRAPYWITDDFGLLTPSGQTYSGFQPTFETDVNDFSVSAGNQYNFNGWNTDLSLTFGSNSVDYTIGNSINVALGSASPTSFDAGAYKFGNIIGNLDVSRTFDAFTVSFGTEARRESFEVTAGQMESYVDGGVQSFPGLQPGNALDEDRTNVGVYGSVDWDATEEFLVSGAVRYENYSDFGDNVSWKLAARYLLANNVGAIRASVSTGFRAPSLHQVYLSNVQTLISGGTVSNQGTFNNVSPVIKGLGIDALDAEEAFNYTVGITLRASDRFSIAADFYNIDLDNRVLFTGEIGFDGDDMTTNSVEQILIDNDVTSIKFFVNAMDTRTTGIDLVLNYDNIEVGSSSELDLILAFNYNKTKIQGDIVTPATLAAEGYEIFNRKEQSRVTTARPDIKATLGASLDLGEFDATLNNTYFGEVTWQHAADPSKDQTFGAKVITDLIVGYDFSDNFRLSLIANNLLDVYPDIIDTKGDVVTDLGGRFLYPWEVNQFGFNGTTLKLNASLSF